MRRLNSRRIAAVLAGVAGVFVAGAALLPAHLFLQILYGVLFSVAAMTAWSYRKAFLEARRAELMTGMHLLSMGIVLAWVSEALMRLWLAVWVKLGRPIPMTEHPGLLLILYLTILGGLLHLAVPALREGEAGRKGRIRVAATLAAGLFFGALLAALDAA